MGFFDALLPSLVGLEVYATAHHRHANQRTLLALSKPS
jgi:hypothetical protein